MTTQHQPEVLLALRVTVVPESVAIESHFQLHPGQSYIWIGIGDVVYKIEDKFRSGGPKPHSEVLHAK